MVNQSCSCNICGETKGLLVWTWKGTVRLPCLSAQAKPYKQSAVKQSKVRKLAGMKMEMKPQF